MGVVGAAVVGLLFPGQGSQFVGMGRDVADAFPEARLTFEEADDTLGFSISRLAWDGPDDALVATSAAQPAILTHSIAVYRVVRERLGGVACAAGHSLGEFTAYVAAGSLSFADGLRTVRLRGELMQQTGTTRSGAMAALLGLDGDAVEHVCAEASTGREVCIPANYNSPVQIVISGDTNAIERAMGLAKEAGAKRAMRLNVSGAFHSPLMQPAAEGLAAHLNGTDMKAPAFPVVSNVTTQPVTDAGDARRLLVEQLTSAVRWTASMRTMLDMGVETVYEVGPGHVLTGLIRRIEHGTVSHAIGTAAEIETVMT